MKLTRQQIREGLEQVPIEAVMLGAVNNSGVSLTHKQKRFAEEIAKGNTKAGAYRAAYNSKGNPKTAHKRGAELMSDSRIQGYSEAIKAALEAQRFATPAGLRALTIHELTKGALSAEMPPAQRVKCLELLGKITEVALFTERREIIKVTDSAQARSQLLDSLRAAIKAEAVDVDTINGDDLLAELAAIEHNPGPGETTEADDPPGGYTPDALDACATPLHSNPHNESGPISAGTQSTLDSDVEDVEEVEPDRGA